MEDVEELGLSHVKMKGAQPTEEEEKLETSDSQKRGRNRSVWLIRKRGRNRSI